jgi:hypothetical protein
MSHIKLISLSILVSAISLIIDINNGNDSFVFFQRAGSLIVILGVIFESKYLLKVSDTSTLYIKELKVGLDVDETINEKETSIIDLKKHLGFYFVIAGTLIWGYGDLVGKLFT